MFAHRCHLKSLLFYFVYLNSFLSKHNSLLKPVRTSKSFLPLNLFRNDCVALFTKQMLSNPCPTFWRRLVILRSQWKKVLVRCSVMVKDILYCRRRQLQKKNWHSMKTFKYREQLIMLSILTKTPYFKFIEIYT